MRALIGFSFALSCLLALSVSARQSTPAAQSPPANPAVSDPKILLDVVVTDKGGNPISGLQQQDFTLLDDKQPRTITSFQANGTGQESDSAVHVILLADAVNTSPQSVSFLQQQMDRFLRKDGGHLPVPMSLVIFTDTSTRVQTHETRDGNALAEDLNSSKTGLRVIGRSQGFYGAADRLQLSLRTLEGLTRYQMSQPGRKFLIWFSPGWPLLSGPGIELTTKDQGMLFQNVVSFSQALREARMTLYSVDPLGMADAGSFQTFYYQSFLKGVTAPKNVQSGNLALQVLAAQSGGRVLNSSNDLGKLVGECLQDSKAFYTLTFEAPPADRPNEYHDIEVKLDKPGLTARTRNGYYAQPYVSGGRNSK